MATATAGVHMLASEHADAIQRFASDPELARMVGVALPLAPDAGATVVARTAVERLEGAAYWSAVVDRGDVKGLCALLRPYTSEPHVSAWIEPAARRQGYGGLAIRMTLEFAFRNLPLQHVHADAPADDAAVARTLAKFGFMPDAPAASGMADSPNATTHYCVTRAEWITHRDRPALAKLHPALRAILDAELAAGNEVAETGGGWPDGDSVFVRLRDPFRTKPSVPADVTYTEPNDPHWWKADYSSRSPRHILAC